MHRAIRVVKTSHFPQVQIISGSRLPYSDPPYNPLPRLTRRRYVWSERQSSHLKPMGIRKYYPIKVKPLTVRGSQKDPSTLTNFLSEEQYIQTKDISQEIGKGFPHSIPLPYSFGPIFYSVPVDI